MADERAAAFSPNRRWMTLAILETGRPERVYIERFPEGGHRVLVSSAAAEPRWSPAGDEIFYRSLNGRELWSVPVDMESGELGTPRRLVEGPYQRTDTGFFASYDVSRDGRRFLMIRENESQAPEVVHVVVNGVRSTERGVSPE